MELTPTTELDAVNVMLRTIGEIPLSTLEGIAFTDAADAQATLLAVSRETQQVGWYFNRDENYEFTPASDGQVELPPNVLSIRPATSSSGCRDQRKDIIPRAGKLFDRGSASYEFSEDDPPVVDVVWFYDFEQLPEAARRYITVAASVIFQTEKLGNDQLYVYTSKHATRALETLQEEERLYERNEGANMFTDSHDVLDAWLR